MRVVFYGGVADNKQNPKKVFLIYGEREKITIFAQKPK